MQSAGGKGVAHLLRPCRAVGDGAAPGAGTAAVLAEAVAQMRQRGKPDCEMADLFMDLKSINMTVAVMAKALIAGRIDCKTAGGCWCSCRQCQSYYGPCTAKDTKAAKKTGFRRRFTQRKRRSEERGERSRNNLPLIYTDNTDLRAAEANLTAETRSRGEDRNPEGDWAANEREQTRIALAGRSGGNREQTWLGARASGIVERGLSLKNPKQAFTKFFDVLAD